MFENTIRFPAEERGSAQLLAKLVAQLQAEGLAYTVTLDGACWLISITGY